MIIIENYVFNMMMRVEVTAMSEKQELIKKMLELQKKFIEYEQQHGVEMVDYYYASQGHPLENYRQQYNELAMKLVDLAHEQKGSHR